MDAGPSSPRSPRSRTPQGSAGATPPSPSASPSPSPRPPSPRHPPGRSRTPLTPVAPPAIRIDPTSPIVAISPTSPIAAPRRARSASPSRHRLAPSHPHPHLPPSPLATTTTTTPALVPEHAAATPVPSRRKRGRKRGATFTLDDDEEPESTEGIPLSTLDTKGGEKGDRGREAREGSPHVVFERHEYPPSERKESEDQTSKHSHGSEEGIVGNGNGNASGVGNGGADGDGDRDKREEPAKTWLGKRLDALVARVLANPRIAWIPPKLTWDDIKPAIRISVSAWVGFLLILIRESGTMLGIAAFLVLIVACMVPPFQPFVQVLEIVLNTVFYTSIAWAWCAIATVIAHSTRVPTDPDLVGQAMARHPNAKGVNLELWLVTEGVFLQENPAIVCCVFLSVGTGILLWWKMRTAPSPATFPLVLSCIIIDATLTVTPLYGKANYMLAFSLWRPIMIQSAIGLACSAVIFPVSVTSQFRRRFQGVLKPLETGMGEIERLFTDASSMDTFGALDKDKHRVTFDDPTAEREAKIKAWGDRSAEIRTTLVASLAGMQPLQSQVRYLGVDISYGRLSGHDMWELFDILASVQVRASGMSFFFNAIVNKVRHTHLDSQGFSALDTVTQSISRNQSRADIQASRTMSRQASRTVSRQGSRVDVQSARTVSRQGSRPASRSGSRADLVESAPPSRAPSRQASARDLGNHDMTTDDETDDDHRRSESRRPSHVDDHHEHDHEMSLAHHLRLAFQRGSHSRSSLEKHQHAHHHGLHHGHGHGHSRGASKSSIRLETPKGFPLVSKNSSISLLEHLRKQQQPVGVYESQRYMDLERGDERDLERLVVQLELLSCGARPLVKSLRRALGDAITWTRTGDKKRHDFLRTMQKTHGVLSVMLEEFKEHRTEVTEPYRHLFDPSQPATDISTIQHAGLYYCFVAQYHLIEFSDAVIKLLAKIIELDNKRQKRRLWFPYSWIALFGQFQESVKHHTEDGTEGETQQDVPHDEDEDEYYHSDGETTGLLGEARRRDPDYRPFNSPFMVLLSKLSKIPDLLGSRSAMFALKAGMLSALTTLPAFLSSSASFYYNNRGMWCTVMAQMTLAVFSGDTLSSWMHRMVATFWGILVGMAVWYVGAGGGTGNPFGLGVVTAVVFPFAMFARLYYPAGVLTTVVFTTSIMLVVGYSWQNGNIVRAGTTTWGWDVAWRRYVCVVIGISAAWVWSVVPPSFSAKKAIRQSYARSIMSVGRILCDLLSTANDPHYHTDDGQYRRTRKELLKARTKLSKMSVRHVNAVNEVSVRGRWPEERYQGLLNTLVETMSLLAQLNHLLPQMDIRWRRALLARTRMADPLFLGDVLAVISMTSAALKSAAPLPQITPGPLVAKYHMNKYKGLDLPLDPHHNDDLPDHVTVEVLESDDYMRYALGVTTVYALMARLDAIVVACKTLLGENFHIGNFRVDELTLNDHMA